jgi:hypothetical protein
MPPKQGSDEMTKPGPFSRRTALKLSAANAAWAAHIHTGRTAGKGSIGF